MIQLLYASKQYCLVKNFLVNRGCQKFRHMWLQDSYLLQKLAQCVLPILLIQQKPFAKVVYNCRLKGPALFLCFLPPFYQSSSSLKSQLFLPSVCLRVQLYFFVFTTICIIKISRIKLYMFPGPAHQVQLYLPSSVQALSVLRVKRSSDPRVS